MVQQLPAAAPVVEAILPSLHYLDSRALAALLKGLAKAGLGQRAVDIFDHLRCVGQGCSSLDWPSVAQHRRRPSTPLVCRRACELAGACRPAMSWPRCATSTPTPP